MTDVKSVTAAMKEVKGIQAFELTWVVYDPTDPLGALLALFTLSPM